MKKAVLNILKKFIGIILVLVGLFALVTPLTPGAWLALIGLEMLGLGFIWKDILKPFLMKMLPNKFTSSSRTPDR